MTGGSKSAGARAKFGVSLAAFAAMFAASLINLLHFQAYPLARLEVALLLAVLIGISAGLALVTARLGRVGQAAMVGLVAMLAADFNSDGFGWAAAAGAIGAVVAWRVGAGEAMRFAALAGMVIAITGMIGLGGRAEPIRTRGPEVRGDGKAPLVVHLILDEQAGPAGMKGGAALAERYRQMGFDVYPQAYSRHYHTKNALAELLTGRDPLGGPRGPRFDDQLRAAGLTVRFVTDSGYLSLCGLFPGARCTTVGHASLRALDSAAIPVSGKADILAYHFAGLSTVARKIANAWDKMARQAGLTTIELRSVRKLPHVNAMAAVPHIEASLKKARGGEYHLVHLLVPHAPYSLDRNCRIRPPGEWTAERSDHSMALRDAAYAEQSACAEKVAERLVRAVEQSPGGKQAVILIQGDHGSRIVEHEPFGKDPGPLDDDTLRRSFSALFAVRLPGQSGGTIRDGQWAVNDLFDGLVDRHFKALPPGPPGKPFIYIEDQRWRPVRRHPLPDWNRTSERDRGASENA